MDQVLRAAVIYGVLLVLFRIAGKRVLAKATSFDLGLLLVISEAVQNALVGLDHSITNAVVVVATLVLLDVGLSFGKQRFPLVERVIDGEPLVLLRDGVPLRERLARERIHVEDILTAGREQHGIETLGEIKHAVLERSDGISVIPYRPGPAPDRPARARRQPARARRRP